MDPKLKVRPLDIEVGGEYIVVLNEDWANKKGIIPGDRIKITRNGKELIAIVDTSSKRIKKGEIGIFEEVEQAYGLKPGDKVNIKRIEETDSPRYIKKKLDGKKLSYKEIKTIIRDIVDNRLSDAEISAFVVSTHTRNFSMKEISYLTRAVAETGEVLKWDEKPICNKHCLGGVPGNRTTMVVVPIVAAAGLKIPKTSSRAITSPSGTADTVEVLADVSFNAEDLKKIVDKTNGSMAWGGATNMASADAKMIKIRNPLRLDPKPLLLTSIMAKKKASGSTHVLIDIPYGERAKVTKKEAKNLKKEFKRVGNMANIKTKVLLTDGSEPIGNGIGPLLEVRDVLKILERKDDRPLDLERKSIKLASEILKMTGKFDKPKEKTKEILESGKALDKFKEIIKAQDGDSSVTSSDLNPAEFKKVIKASKEGKIKHIDNIYISETARRLGCPGLKKSGVFLHHHTGDRVKEGEKLLTLYANNKADLEGAYEYYSENNPVRI